MQTPKEAPNDNNGGPDDLDFEILSLLQHDGRMSLTVMSQKLEVSVSTIRTRLSRLLAEQTIQIIGRVNAQKVGFHAYAHINIAVRPAKLIDTVAQELMQYREVSFLALTTGEFDLEVDVMCRDNNHLLDLTNKKISTLEGVFQLKTDLYSKVLKYAQPDLNLLR